MFDKIFPIIINNLPLILGGSSLVGFPLYMVYKLKFSSNTDRFPTVDKFEYQFKIHSNIQSEKCKTNNKNFF